jgi:CPA2 family monovalent cation:H+ antiporter-2
VLFFVSVGMLLDPMYVLEDPWRVATTLGVVVLAKPLAALAITTLFRYRLEVGLSVAVALAQIGEFSFIVAALGNQLGVLTLEATNTIVAASIASIMLNPILYRSIAPAIRWRTLRKGLEVAAEEAAHEAPSSAYRAIVIGYGPTGRTVARLLRENEIEPTVVEMNIDTVRKLQADGMKAIYGDASHIETLQAAGVGTARSVALTVGGMAAPVEAIRLARELNPRIQILARATSIREQVELKRAGADYVFSGEAEVALALTEAVLMLLGATPEQIERERARVHAELVRDPATA